MEENIKILLCEDDENLGMLLREYLQAKGFTTILCPDGEAGYKEFNKNKFDIAVLDVMMPKKDGFTLAQEIRQTNADLPIIFLTAKTLKEDILEGFKIGADDYITKPFCRHGIRDSRAVRPLPKSCSATTTLPDACRLRSTAACRNCPTSKTTTWQDIPTASSKANHFSRSDTV